MKHASRVGAGALAWSLVSATLPAAPLSPMAILDRMDDAVRQLDYEGRFVVQSGDHLEAMYIVHRVDDGVEKERVVSLTGHPREIIRSDEAVACVLPGGEGQINVGRRPTDRSFSPLHGVSAEQLAQSYRIAVVGSARVAGRDADQLLIEPLDALRYGYRVYVDRASGLPLRSMTLGEHGQALSQMMFVELRTDQPITPIEHDVSAMQRARAGQPAALPADRLAAPSWSFGELPPGFRLNVHRRKLVSGGVREHFIFSDGLASVSVYVRPADGKALSGVSDLGSTKAMGRVIDGHEAVAVGEVPVETLRLFTDALREVKR